MKYKKHYQEYESIVDTPFEEYIKEKYKRSKRRKDKERKKKLSSKIYGTIKFADHMKPCSCYMCRNPRHGWKPEKTIQEKKIDLYNEEEYD